MNGLSIIDFLEPTSWPTVVLISGRVIGMMVTAPMWSMPVLPRNVRIASGVMLTLALLPAVPPVALPADVILLPFPLAVEILIGLLIGLTVALFVHGVAIAGEVVSVQMGLAIANAIAPSSAVAGPGIGGIKNLLAIAIFFVIGGHLLVIRGLAESFQVLPPGGPAAVAAGGAAFVQSASSVFIAAVRLAAPLMVAMMLATAVVAVLSRAVPQLNTLMVAFPVTIGLGFVVLAAAVPSLAVLMREWVESIPESIAATIQSLTPIPTGP